MGLEQLAFPDVVLRVPLSHLWICWMGSWSRELHQFEANVLLGCNKRSHQVTGWNLCSWRNMCVCARTVSATFFSMNAVPSTQRKPSSKLTCVITFFLHWIHQCVCVSVRTPVLSYWLYGLYVVLVTGHFHRENEWVSWDTGGVMWIQMLNRGVWFIPSSCFGLLT